MMRQGVKATVRADIPERPAISVVVPITGGAEALERTLSSLERQDLAEMEFICIDDATEDGCSQVAYAALRRDARVTIARHDRRTGYGCAVNEGLELARGRWVAVIEEGDFVASSSFYSTLLDKAVQLEMEDERVDAVIAPYIHERVGIGGRRCYAHSLYRRRLRGIEGTFDLSGNEDAAVLFREEYPVWAAIYRRTFLMCKSIAAGEDPEAGSLNDAEMFANAMLSASKMAYVDCIGYVHRDRSSEEVDSMLAERPGVVFGKWAAVVRAAVDRGIENPLLGRVLAARGLALWQKALSGPGGGEGFPVDDLVRLLDADTVMAEPSIPPSVKREFAERADIDHVDVTGYRRSLVKNGLRRVYNVAWKFNGAAVR